MRRVVVDDDVLLLLSPIRSNSPKTQIHAAAAAQLLTSVYFFYLTFYRDFLENYWYRTMKKICSREICKLFNLNHSLKSGAIAN